jgi:hypothetical protein
MGRYSVRTALECKALDANNTNFKLIFTRASKAKRLHRQAYVCKVRSSDEQILQAPAVLVLDQTRYALACVKPGQKVWTALGGNQISTPAFQKEFGRVPRGPDSMHPGRY